MWEAFSRHYLISSLQRPPELHPVFIPASWRENEDWREKGFLTAGELPGPHVPVFSQASHTDLDFILWAYPVLDFCACELPDTLSRLITAHVLLVPQVQREFLAKSFPAESQQTEEATLGAEKRRQFTPIRGAGPTQDLRAGFFRNGR